MDQFSGGGSGDSKPDIAGWYIVCNGRVVLSADRSDETGWGSVSDQKDGIPKYHNQYARFRGVVFFNCKSSKKLPWNTTKTGLDPSNSVWQYSFQKMIDHTRTVIRYLNQLDQDIDDSGGQKASALFNSLKNETRPTPVEKLAGNRGFTFNRNARAPGPPMTKIQYSRERSKIDAMMLALGVGSAKAVGEATFDAVYEDQELDEE